MKHRDTYFGYNQNEWRQLVDEGRRFLKSVAELGRTTTYTESCTVVRQRSGVEIDTGEYALAFLLGEIAEEARRESGAFLTSLVLYLDDNRPGEGFFKLAEEEGLLPSGQLTRSQKEEFWTQQVAAVHAAYRKV